MVGIHSSLAARFEHIGKLHPWRRRSMWTEYAHWPMPLLSRNVAARVSSGAGAERDGQVKRRAMVWSGNDGWA